MIKSIADLLIFLSLNIIGIFLLVSGALFLVSIFNKKAKERIFDRLGINYKKINRMMVIAIVFVLFISYVILGKDFFTFFNNKFVLILVILGIANFVYTGWIRK